jgi:peptidoglycan LD-endopeptidase LytH
MPVLAFMLLLTAAAPDPEAVPARAQDPASPDTIYLPLFTREMVVPVAGVRPEDLTDTFRDRRSGGRTHHAIDIMAPRGTPVLAATDGRVLRLQNSRLGGIAVYQIDDAGERILYYAHLDRYAPHLEPGMFIFQGDTIGYVGTTGNAPASAPHLHFAVWEVEDPENLYRGRPVNPYELLVD